MELTKLDTSDQFYKSIFKNFVLNTIVSSFFTPMNSPNSDTNNIFDNMNKIIDVINVLENTKNFKDKLNKLYLENSTNNIITYLRIRCDKTLSTNSKIQLYNQRFNIQVNDNNSLMNIKYNHHNFRYYTRDASGKLKLSNKLSQNIGLPQYKEYYQQRTYNNNSNPSDFKPSKYEYKYKIGPFHNIFPPNNRGNIVKNSDISMRLKQIIPQLEAPESERKPVFIIGYGASGSGKTSSLIYFNKGTNDDERNGVLITLCNKFAEKNNTYRKISLRSYEFYSDPTRVVDAYDPNNIITKVVPKSSSSGNSSSPTSSSSFINFIFNQTNGQFVLENEYNHFNTFIDRTKEPNTLFNKDDPMGKVLIHLIDNDRYVKATPNNPNSSRSHSVVIIKFIKNDGTQETNPPTLIIGDFAGVENIFDCEDIETVKGFSNAHINGNSSKPKFYSTYSKSIPKANGTVNASNNCINYTQDLYYPYESGPFRSANNPDHYKDKPLSEKIRLFFENANSAPTYQLMYQQSSTNNPSSKNELEELEKFIKRCTANQGNSLLPNIKEICKSIEININSLVNNGRNNYASIYEQSIHEIFEMFMKHKNTYQNMLHFLDLAQAYQNAKEIYSTFPPQSVTKNKSKTLFQVIFIKQLLILNGVNEEYLKIPIIKKDFSIENYINIIISGTATSTTKSSLIKKINFCIFDNNINIYNNHINNIIKTIIDNTNYTSNFDFKKIEIKNYPTTRVNKSLTKPIGATQNISDCTTYQEDINNILSIQSSGINSKSIFDTIQQKYLQNNFILDTLLPEDKRQLNPIQKIIYFFENRNKDLDINKFKKLIQFIYISTMENYVELHCRIASGKEICTIRKNEGYMINGTLNETREIIQNMILSRNANSIRLIPPFSDSCLPYYCINNDCFTQPYVKNISHNVIFNSIQKEIGESNYSKLLICIFMVLNISPLANNPPPIPYIDIYKLNRIYYKIKNNETYTIASFKKIINDLFDLITIEFKDKSALLQSKDEFTHFKILKEKLNNTTDINKENIKNYLNTIERFIELIHNNNAASSIGTLEFLDNVSKYYTTNVMCKPSNTNNNRNTFKDILETNLSTL